MTIRSKHRGHGIEYRCVWVYSDTGEPVEGNRRDCGKCGMAETPEGHDACIGTLPGVMNACCGHGDEGEAYIMYDDGSIFRGAEAIKRFNT